MRGKFLEGLELGIDIILRYFLAIFIAIGTFFVVFSAISGKGLVAAATPSGFSNAMFWSVLTIGLVIVWREIRELRRRVEHISEVRAKPVYARARAKFGKGA